MATSKRDPPNPSRGRMSPNLMRPSSSASESSGYGHGARRARSVPGSPDRSFGSSSSPSVPAAAASGSTEVRRPSLSSAGRSRTMGSRSSVHGTSTKQAQPFPGAGAASKPTLARAKSDKVSTAATASQRRPPVLAVPPPSSKSFKDMATKVAAANKASPSPSSSLMLRSNKTSSSRPPSADSCSCKAAAAAASPKPSSSQQKVMSLPGAGAARGGGKVQALSSTAVHSPAASAARRRLSDTVNGATTSSKAKSVSSQKAITGASATTSRKEKHKDPSTMQIKGTECINDTTVSIEELPDLDDLKSMEMTVPDEHEPYSNQQEQVFKDDEESKEHFCEEKVDAGANNGIHHGGQDANNGGGVKTIYECGIVEKEAADRSADADKVIIPPWTPDEVSSQVWRKDDPKGNDVIEETKSKLLEERKSRVKALVGAFETVLSFKE